MKSNKPVNSAGIIADRCGPGMLSQIGHLRELQAKQAQALIDLERSLALEALWPNCFNGKGGVTSEWHGKPKYRVTRNDPNTTRGFVVVGPNMYYDLTLHVTNARGVSKDFPQDDVPTILWPNPVKGQL